MVNVEEVIKQRRIWNENRDELLKKYSSGFVVIEYNGLQYYETKQELYEYFPIFAEEKLRFGTRPLLIDIVEEQWNSRN